MVSNSILPAHHHHHYHHHDDSRWLGRLRRATVGLACFLVCRTAWSLHAQGGSDGTFSPRPHVSNKKTIDTTVSTEFSWGSAANLTAPNTDEVQDIWYQCWGPLYYTFVEKLQDFVLERRQYHFNPPYWGDPKHQDL